MQACIGAVSVLQSLSKIEKMLSARIDDICLLLVYGMYINNAHIIAERERLGLPSANDTFYNQVRA